MSAPEAAPAIDRVFELNDNGHRLNVYVTGEPEDYTVSVSNPDRDAFINIPKCDWLRIVKAVEAQF